MSDELVTCPYNSGHRIRASRLQFHIVKCRKSAQAMGFETCPYNTTHVMDKTKLEAHMKTCPGRLGVESISLNQGTRPNLLPVADIEPTENWDADDSVSPLEVVKARANEIPTAVPLVAASKSAKKAHKLKERERVNALHHNK